MRNLLDGLPDEARTRRDQPDDPLWTNETELLAQLLELVSGVAGQPIKVSRPWDTSEDRSERNPRRRDMATPPPSESGIRHTPDGGTVVNGMDALIQFAQQQGAMRQEGDPL